MINLVINSIGFNEKNFYVIGIKLEYFVKIVWKNYKYFINNSYVVLLIR